MKKIFHNLLGLFFPKICVVCHTRISEVEQHLCIDCIVALPKTNFHIEPRNRLERFFAGSIPFERIGTFAHFVKGGSIQKIIHELKYNNNPAIGQFIGELCAEHIKDSPFVLTIDYLVPIPLHDKRLEERGYNQSLEICKGLSKILKIPIDSTALIRSVNNKSQTKYTRIERWENVDGIFKLVKPKKFKNKHILLVDDIITTGSTLTACAKEVLKSEGCKISIFAIGSAN